MNADFIEDLASLCHTDVGSFTEAETVLSLLSELVGGDLHTLSDEALDQCWSAIIHSNAYQLDRKESQRLLLRWLVDSDKLQTERMFFIGQLLLADFRDLGRNCLGSQEVAVKAVIDTIWLYRYTNRTIITLYLMILYHIGVQSRMTQDVLEHCITEEFVNFLFWEIKEQAQEAVWEVVLVILGLNDQYMLHDKRGSENKIFSVLQASPRHYISIGSTLVWLFNRCRETDQDLKIFVCKFLYLVFSTSSTEDLLYTNDLTVLTEILLRELNDLSHEAVEVRAMFLRLLYAIIRLDSQSVSLGHLKAGLIQALSLTVHAAETLPEPDRSEILRLSQRCLDIDWLKTEIRPILKVYSAQEDVSLKNTQEELRASNSSLKPISTIKAVEHRRPPPPPPVPPAPPPHRAPARAPSVVSINSTESSSSIQAVERLCPPPPPPPRRAKAKPTVPLRR